MLPFWPTPISNNVPVADPVPKTHGSRRNDDLSPDMDLASATGEMSEPGFSPFSPFLANTSLVENYSPTDCTLP